MNTYRQSTGVWELDGVVLGTGYSGLGDHKNDPKSDMLFGQGPIPKGFWHVDLNPVNTSTHGPFVLRLYPVDGTVTYGRSGFLVHGDSIEAPGTASHGCIIMPRATREAIARSGVNDLQVVA